MSLFTQFLVKRLVISPETLHRVLKPVANQENAFVYSDSTKHISTISASSPSKPRQVLIKNLQDTIIYLPIHFSVVNIQNCRGCQICIGVTQKSCTIECCAKCQIYIAAESISVNHCNDLDLLAFCTMPLSIRECSTVRVGNYVFFYAAQDTHFRVVGAFIPVDSTDEGTLHPNTALVSDWKSDRASKNLRLMTVEEEDLLREIWVAGPDPQPESKMNRSKKAPHNLATRLVPRMLQMTVTPSQEVQPNDILTVDFDLTEPPGTWDWVGLYLLSGDSEVLPQNASSPETRIAFVWVPEQQNYVHLHIPTNACPGLYELRYYHTHSHRRAIAYSEPMWIGALVGIDTIHFTSHGKVCCNFTQRKGCRLSPSAWMGLYFAGTEDVPECPDHTKYLQSARPSFRYYASNTTEGKGSVEFDAPPISEVVRLSRNFQDCFNVQCRIFAGSYNFITTSKSLCVRLENGLTPLKVQDDANFFKVLVSCGKDATSSAWVAAYVCDESMGSYQLSSSNRVQWTYLKSCKEIFALERRHITRTGDVVICLYPTKSEEPVEQILLRRNSAGRIETVLPNGQVASRDDVQRADQEASESPVHGKME